MVHTGRCLPDGKRGIPPMFPHNSVVEMQKMIQNGCVKCRKTSASEYDHFSITILHVLWFSL